MIAARVPEQRATDARLLTIDSGGRIGHLPRRRLVDVFRAGDLLVANDAATMPASLTGRHVESRRYVEIRLAGCTSTDIASTTSFVAVLFGLGDHRMRTEDRPLPPAVKPGDRLVLGPLTATIAARLHQHQRLVRLVFDDLLPKIWEGIARHGRPVQYAHVQQPLALWDTWTPLAATLVAFEPPSAGFVLDWRTLAAIRDKGVEFATLTHAAGLSSTGDDSLDALLPFDEPYDIPERTADAVRHARRLCRRVVAVGTTVVRALEHAASRDGTVHAGEGLATGRIGSATQLRVVDAILSGTHEPGTSHFELLRAFVDDETLARMAIELESGRYTTHEFGDSVFIDRSSVFTDSARRSRRHEEHEGLCVNC